MAAGRRRRPGARDSWWTAIWARSRPGWRDRPGYGPGIIAELRGGLLDAADAHHDAGLPADDAAGAAICEFGDPGQVAAAFRPGLALSQARRVALTRVSRAAIGR